MSKYQITNNSDLTTLNTHFQDNLYVGGHSPCSEDVLLFEQYTAANQEPSQETHPNLWSWFALVSLYTPQVKDTWRSVVAKSVPAAKPAQAAAPQKKAAAPKKEEKPAENNAEDDFDLFGDDGGDAAAALEEVKKKKEEEKKDKKKKEVLIQKSLVILDVKVWDP